MYDFRFYQACTGQTQLVEGLLWLLSQHLHHNSILGLLTAFITSLQLNVGCNFIYVTNGILVVNIGHNFI
jgi:hypothetical protein